MITAPIVVRFGLAAFTLATLASCGGDQPGPEAIAGPSPTAAGATVSQFASLIAPYERDWNDQVATVEDDCRRVDTLVACNLGYVTLSLLAETVHLVLTGAVDSPDSPDYLGEPPAEISRLIDQTLEAAESVPAAVETWRDSDCVDPLADECLAEALNLRRAVGDLTAAYDSWRPYL